MCHLLLTILHLQPVNEHVPAATETESVYILVMNNIRHRCGVSVILATLQM